jgi:hypothetical protein
MKNSERRVLYALSALALLWAGMLIGVSFLATPVKFLAPSLTLPVALDVGRQTFGVFSLVEIALALVLVSAAIVARRKHKILIAAVLVGALVALEVVWLLPVLDARVEIILNGGTPEESDLHSLYIVFESAKLLLLAAIAWFAHVAGVRPVEEFATHVR